MPRLFNTVLMVAFCCLLAQDLLAEEKRHVAKVSDGIQRVEIVGGEYFFEPKLIVVKVNLPVEMKYRKEGGFVPHELVVEAPQAGIDLNLEMKSDWQTVTFTPTKNGSYQMECQKKLLWFKSHKEQGMHGVIEVVP